MPETGNDGKPSASPGWDGAPPDGPGGSAFAEADAWRGREDPRLARSDKGFLLPTVDNVVLILRRDDAWRDCVALNEFSGVVVKRRTPPFDVAELGDWTDYDDARLELWLAKTYGLRKLPESALQRGVMLAADLNRFHEVREYLEGLTWDGVPRLKWWLHAYLGAEQNIKATEPDYLQLAGAKYLIGAVARILRAPRAVKVENVLILEGPQGAGKSTALKILFDPWFTDAAFEIGSTDGYQIIRGMWGVELPELDSFNRAESSKVKGFFSREVDRYRNPYGRKPVNVVRQCVFCGSVNYGTYAKDDTGSRRLMPVRVGRIDLDELAKDKAQLWAEAVHEYRQGTVWWVRASEKPLFDEAQDERYIGDAWEEKIRKWLDEPLDAGGRRMQVSTMQILGGALGLETSKWTLADQQRVGKIMRRLEPFEPGQPGWKRARVGPREARDWVYVRVEASQ